MREITEFQWTDELAARARHLRDVEGLSNGQVAARLGGGCTRNAVIGKLSRMDNRAAREAGRAHKPTGPKSPIGGAGAVEAARLRMAAATPPPDGGEPGGPVRIASPNRAHDGSTRAQMAGIRNAQPVKIGKGYGSDGPVDVDLGILKGAIWKPLDGRDPVPLELLKPSQCKWPLGDPLEPGFGYCGLPHAEGDNRYCSRHARASAAAAPAAPANVTKRRELPRAASRILEAAE